MTKSELIHELFTASERGLVGRNLALNALLDFIDDPDITSAFMDYVGFEDDDGSDDRDF